MFHCVRHLRRTLAELRTPPDLVSGPCRRSACRVAARMARATWASQNTWTCTTSGFHGRARTDPVLDPRRDAARDSEPPSLRALGLRRDHRARRGLVCRWMPRQRAVRQLKPGSHGRRSQAPTAVPKPPKIVGGYSVVTCRIRITLSCAHHVPSSFAGAMALRGGESEGCETRRAPCGSEDR